MTCMSFLYLLVFRRIGNRESGYCSGAFVSFSLVVYYILRPAGALFYVVKERSF